MVEGEEVQYLPLDTDVETRDLGMLLVVVRDLQVGSAFGQVCKEDGSVGILWGDVHVGWLLVGEQVLVHVHHSVELIHFEVESGTKSWVKK